MVYSPLKSENGGMSVRNKYKYMALVLGVVACAMGYMLMSYANDNKIWITKHDALLRRLQQATKKNRLFTQDLLTCKAKGKEMLLANNENVKVIAGFKEDLKELKNDVTANDNKFMKCYRFYQDVKDILGLTEQVGSRFKDPVDGNVPLAVFTEVEDNIRTLQRNLTNEIDEKRSAIENKEEALSLNEQLREAANTVKQNMKEAQAQFQDQLNDCNSKMAVVSSNAENSKARIATLEGNLQTSQHEVARLELQDKIKTQVMENTKQMMTDMAAARKSEVSQPKQVAPSESKPVVKTNQGSIVDTSVTLEKPSEPVVAQEVKAEVVAEKPTLPEEKELPTVDLTKKISVSSDAVKAVQPSSDLTIAKENVEDSSDKSVDLTSETVQLVKDPQPTAVVKEKKVAETEEVVEIAEKAADAVKISEKAAEVIKSTVSPPVVEIPKDSVPSSVNSQVKVESNVDNYQSTLKQAMEKKEKEELDLLPAQPSRTPNVDDVATKNEAKAALEAAPSERIIKEDNENDVSEEKVIEDVESNLTERKLPPASQPAPPKVATEKPNVKATQQSEDEADEEDEEEEEEDATETPPVVKKPALPMGVMGGSQNRPVSQNIRAVEPEDDDRDFDEIN